MSSFPREIVDLIVQHLPYDAAGLLFVSRIFRASARAAIFRHMIVTFSLTRDNPRISLLVQVIQGDPSVLNGTRQLAIHLDKLPTRDHPSEGGDVTVTDDHFSTLIPLLCNAPILKLEVKGISGGTGLSMSELLPAEVEGLIALRSLPSLVEVSIVGLSECSSLLLTHPNHQITTLGFFAGPPRRTRPSEPPQIDRRIFERGPTECGILLGLQNLRVYNPYEFLRLIWESLQQHAPKPSIRIPALTTLSVSELSADGLDALGAVIASCPVLETLELRYRVFDCPITKCVALRKASRFSKLHVDFGSHLNQGHMVRHLRNLASFLKAYTPMPHLQEVVASVDWEESQMIPHTLVILRGGFLPELRDALSSLGSPTLLFILRVSFLEDHTQDTSTLDKSRAALKGVLDGFVFPDGVKFVYELLPSHPNAWHPVV